MKNRETYTPAQVKRIAENYAEYILEEEHRNPEDALRFARRIPKNVLERLIDLKDLEERVEIKNLH